MSFKSFIKGLVVIGVGIATGGASLLYEAAAAAGAYLASGTIGAMVARGVLAIGISKLVANRAGTKAAGGDAPSARFMPRISTTNKIPLIYGSAYTGPVMTDAIISTDNKTMWYVLACSEVTDAGSISFGDMYVDGRLITFDGTDQTKVVSLTNNTTPPQVDTNIAGNMYIYKYSNGSSSGVNTAQTAIQVLQDSAIPVARRWTSTNTMDNTSFVIVKLNYNFDKQVTGLGEIKLNMINSLNKPGEVLLDYMQNTRYGCAIPLTQIDTASLSALNTYSDALITYTPVGGGSATQARYRINGPLDLSTNCLSNLQDIADACDSWIQYSELVGKWKVVINKEFTGVLGDLYSVDSSVLIGGIDIIPLDLNQTYNSLEVQYPNNPIKDQTDVRIIDLTDPSTDWYRPDLLSPNEADNRLTIQYQIVNNYVQAIYLGVRRLLQSREDLTIQCNLDYSGIQVEAGDVVRVTLAEYGWVDKLFRVSTVTEVKQANGNLGASIIAFEYNDDVFADNAIQNFVLEDNTGLTDPNIFDKPSTPIIYNGPIANGAINYYTVSSNVPAAGTTLFLDFNIGNSSNVQTHKSYSSVAVGDGTPYTANSTITINVADSNPGTYYWSATARNLQAGRQSNSSSAFTWVGPAVTSYNLSTFVCAYSSGNVVTTAESTANVRVGMNVIVSSGTGAVAANTLVTAVTSANTFTINPSPTTAFSCATLKVGGGGITYNQINPSLGLSQGIGGATFTITQSGLLPVNVTSTSTRNIPVFIQGAGFGASSLYPFYQGTSSATSGTNGNTFYAASSTGQFTPNNASTLVINDGEDEWYKVLYDDFPAGTLTNDEQYNMNFGYQLVSDTDNTLIQIVPALRQSLPYYEADTQYMNALVLYADVPVTQGYLKTTSGTASTFDGGAVFFRNLTAGSTVYVVTGTIASSKSPKSYF